MSELKQSSVALLEEAIDRKIRNAQRGRDTTLATVTRVDSDGTTWVRVYGGAEETPVRRMTSSAQVGDTINVVFSGLSCMGVGNVTNPSASVVQVESVEIAARGAAVAAQEAWVHADDAAVAAQTAWSHADDAATAAQNAWDHADDAATAAQNAWDHADDAADAASNANKSATNALIQLGIVQDVVGVLNYVAEHGGFVQTQDAEIVEGKVYFTLDSQTGDYVPVVDPQASQLSSYYEVSEDYDDVMGDFIMAHLAVTSRGLWVLPSGVGSSTTPASGESQADSDARQGANYKMLLSNDGTYIYDGTGALVIKYGQNIEPSNDRPFYIGDPNSTSYILFTPAAGGSAAHISIGGGVTIGSDKTLSELLTADDINVGGRNLILGTADAISTSDNLTTLSISTAANELASDDDVTLTFYASASESIWIDFYWYTTSGSTWNPFYPAFNLTTDRTRYSVTLKAGGSAANATSIRLRKSTSSHGSSSATGTIYVDSLKLERGNVATDWTPAPEDMATTGDVAATQPLIIGTQAAATRFWTGNCPELSSLAQGQHITYFLPYAYKKETAQSKGITAEELVPTETVTTEYSNDWLKLTLSDGSDTGWVPIYYQGTTRLTSHYGAGMVIPLVYREGYSSSIPRGWWGASQYYVNQIDRRQHNDAVKAAVDITKYAICGGTSAGYRKLAAGVTFDLSYPILYLNANTASGQEYAIAANATSTAFYEACPSVTFTNTATIQSGAANKTLYVKGTVSGNTFTVASSNFLTTVESSQETAPTEFYIPIGLMTSGTVGYFATSKDLYAYIDGKFRQVTPTEIVSTHKVYYRTDTELATSAARQAIKPTAWVSESAGIVYNQWTPSLPPVAAYASSGTDGSYVKYPYVYMCEQRKRLDGTVDCTAVVPHEADLIVDGDAIIDGTVSANKLVARSITANYIDTTDLQVDSANIKGQLSVNQIDTSGISLTKTQVVDLDSNLASLSDGIDAQASALENSVGGINQAIESTNASLSNLTQTVTNVAAELDGRIKTITDSIDIDADHISLITQTTSGGTTEKMEARLTSSKLAFVQDGTEVAYIGNESLNITNAVVQDTLTLGDFAFVPLASGGLALKWMGN